MRKLAILLLALGATWAWADEARVRTFGGGFSTRWRTHGPHGHDQVHPCQQDTVRTYLPWGVIVSPGNCDLADFQRGNLDDSIGYRVGVERDFAKAGIFRFVGSADGSISSTEYNLSQNDFFLFGAAASGGVDLARWGGRIGVRYGAGTFLSSVGHHYGFQVFREVVLTLPLRSGASLRIGRRNIENRLGMEASSLGQPTIEVDETSVMFVASPEARATSWEFATSSGTSFPGGVGGNRELKPAGWHRLTAVRKLCWLDLEMRGTWTAFAHESRQHTDFRGFRDNERSKTVDSFGLGAWREQRLGHRFSVHYGGGFEIADWRDEHHLLLDRELQDIIGGVETGLVAGAAFRMRTGRGTALEVHAEQAYWSHIGLGETRWGLGLVLTR